MAILTSKRRKSNNRRCKDWTRKEKSWLCHTTIFGFVILQAKMRSWSLYFLYELTSGYFSSVAIKPVWLYIIIIGNLLIVETKSIVNPQSLLFNLCYLLHLSDFSQKEFPCCPGENSSPWQRHTVPAVSARVCYYQKKFCYVYSPVKCIELFYTCIK